MPDRPDFEIDRIDRGPVTALLLILPYAITLMAQTGTEGTDGSK
jgi:hypothetical protein